MHKKVVGFILPVMLFLLGFAGTASANLDDTRASIQARYGDSGLVIDVTNKLWTKADWDARHTTEEATYRHVFSRHSIRITMDVEYENSRPEGKVVRQRFQPDLPLTIKDFKTYFPEVYQDFSKRAVQVFTTQELLTRNFNEKASPLTLGIVTKDHYLGKDADFHAVWAFNISDGGRIVKDVRYIDQDTLITEFVIERKDSFKVKESLGYEQGKGIWQPTENYFIK